jgi:hypothetical protein
MKITDHIIGKRTYELSNHLWNVLSTVSDKPLPHGSSGDVDYWLADIRTATDYSPLEVTLEDRDFQITDPNAPKVLTEEDAIYSNLSASTVVDAAGNLVKVLPNGAWGHAGASCEQVILPGEYIQFEAGSEGSSYNSSVFVGLSYTSDPDYQYTSIDFAWYLYQTNGAPQDAKHMDANSSSNTTRNVEYSTAGISVSPIPASGVNP